MSDDVLCFHGRPIACLECAAEFKRELETPPPVLGGSPLAKYAQHLSSCNVFKCVTCGHWAWKHDLTEDFDEETCQQSGGPFTARTDCSCGLADALRLPAVPPEEVEAKTSILGAQAIRTVESLSAMLGWMNVPPQHVLEAEIRALKARAPAVPPLEALVEQLRTGACNLSVLRGVVDKAIEKQRQYTKLPIAERCASEIAAQLWTHLQSALADLQSALADALHGRTRPEPK